MLKIIDKSSAWVNKSSTGVDKLMKTENSCTINVQILHQLWFLIILQLTNSTGIKPHVPVHERRESCQAPHGLVWNVLAHGMAPLQPLLLSLYDHVMWIIWLPTATCVGTAEASTGALACNIISDYSQTRWIVHDKIHQIHSFFSLPEHKCSENCCHTPGILVIIVHRQKI